MELNIDWAQSPTSLGCYLTCPLQYYAKYISKEVAFSASVDTEYGVAVHSDIEQYLERGRFPDKRSVSTELVAVENPSVRGAKFIELLDKWGFKSGAYRGAEVQLSYDYVLEGGALRVPLRCTVDYLAEGRDCFVALDWKTGKVPSHRGRMPLSYKIQGAVISACVEGLYRKPCKVGFVYLKGEGAQGLKVLGADKKLLDKTIKDLNGAWGNLIRDERGGVKVIENDVPKGFEGVRNGLCGKWCDVLSCPFNGRGGS